VKNHLAGGTLVQGCKYRVKMKSHINSFVDYYDWLGLFNGNPVVENIPVCNCNNDRPRVLVFHLQLLEDDKEWNSFTGNELGLIFNFGSR
jgi:hypothetical protein